MSPCPRGSTPSSSSTSSSPVGPGLPTVSPRSPMRSPEIINLSFHGVGTPPLAPREPGEHDYWIGHDGFLAVLDEVVGRDDVRLSFDDGNASDVEAALPA